MGETCQRWCNGHSRYAQLELEGGESKFLALLCCVGVVETHLYLHRQTGTGRVTDPPALAFVRSLPLLSSALVSACCPKTPPKSELGQCRIPEPLILVNPVPFAVLTNNCNDCPNPEFSPTILPLAGKFPKVCTPFPVCEPMETY